MKNPPRYEIKFTWWSDVDSEMKTLNRQMMCVPREGENIEALRGRNGNLIGDFTVENVSYQRVGKHDDGSHGIVVELQQWRKGSSRLEDESTVGFI